MNFLWILPLLFQVSLANELLPVEYSKSAEYEAFLTNRSLWESFDMQNYDYYYKPRHDKNITKLGLVWGVVVLINGVEALPTQRHGGVWMSIDDLFEKIENAFETDEFKIWHEKYATETEYGKWWKTYYLAENDYKEENNYVYNQYNMTVEYDETYGYPSLIRMKRDERVEEVMRASFSLDDFDSSSMDENEMEDYSPASKHSILSLAVAILGVALTYAFA